MEKQMLHLLKGFIKSISGRAKEQGKLREDLVSIDKTYLFAISANNLIAMVEALKYMLKPLGVEVTHADGPGLLLMGEVIYYIIDNEEFSIMIWLPLAFCDENDVDVLQKWRERQNGK